MKLGMGPAVVLKPGQLKEKRKSSLAIGPQRSGIWLREGSAVSVYLVVWRGTGGRGFLLVCQLMTDTRLSSNPLILLLLPDFTMSSFFSQFPPQSSDSFGSWIWTHDPTTQVPPHPTVCRWELVISHCYLIPKHDYKYRAHALRDC